MLCNREQKRDHTSAAKEREESERKLIAVADLKKFAFVDTKEEYRIIYGMILSLLSSVL